MSTPHLSDPNRFEFDFPVYTLADRRLYEAHGLFLAASVLESENGEPWLLIFTDEDQALTFALQDGWTNCIPAPVNDFAVLVRLLKDQPFRGVKHVAFDLAPADKKLVPQECYTIANVLAALQPTDP